MSYVIKGQVDSICWWGRYSTEGESSNFLPCRETPPPPKKKTFLLVGHCNDFEKSK